MPVKQAESCTLFKVKGAKAAKCYINAIESGDGDVLDDERRQNQDSNALPQWLRKTDRGPRDKLDRDLRFEHK